MDQSSVINLAREFTEQHNPNGQVPFPFAETLDSLGEVELSYLQTSNGDISGAIFLENGTYNIVINSDKPPKRQYFTLAHELAHYVLHKNYLQDSSFPGFVDFGSLDNASALLRPDTMPTELESLQREREANTFAAEILMPEDKVREFYDLNGDIKDTANAFQVSVAAMAVRLEKLGLA
jgi:Zn-dependent peptidase ImmA (M78 family)